MKPCPCGIDPARCDYHRPEPDLAKRAMDASKVFPWPIGTIVKWQYPGYTSYNKVYELQRSHPQWVKLENSAGEKNDCKRHFSDLGDALVELPE